MPGSGTARQGAHRGSRPHPAGAPLAAIRIRGFRSARDVSLAPGPLTALLGAAGSGKSNLLVAVWKLLAPTAQALGPGDPTGGAGRPVRIEARLASGGDVGLAATAELEPLRRWGTPPSTYFLPAGERSDGLLADGLAPPAPLRRALERSRSSSLALLAGLEAWAAEAIGVVLLIEEPELFLPPQAQRALYRLLRQFAAAGNQVLYSTHAATFLNVSRLDELALVELDRSGVTRIRRPQALPAEESFRAASEFDAERSELLLARAVLLVEGRTEKLVFPFLYRALGFDADAEGISIVECGGKPNIPVFAEVCNRVGIPYLVVHDRDAAAGEQPIATEVAVNEAIERVAGPERTIELVRDFEEVARLHGHRHKPERALHWFALAERADDVPEPLTAVVRRTVALARGVEADLADRHRGGPRT